MKYRAVVTKVGTKGRIKVKCPDVWDKQESPWCYPCIPFLNLAYQPKTKRNVDEESKYNVRIPKDLYQSEKLKVPDVDSKLDSKIEELMDEIKKLIEESKGNDKDEDDKEPPGGSSPGEVVKPPSTKPVETPIEPPGGSAPVEPPTEPEEEKGKEYTLMKPNKASKNLKVNASEKCKLRYVIRLPEEGEYVWLEFEKDDVNSTPIYVGTWGDDEFWEKIEAEL